MMRTIENLSLQKKVLLIVLSAGLVGCLAMMVASPARAKLEFFSPEYVAEIQQTHIGVVLTEQTGAEEVSRVVSGDDQLIQDQAALLGEDLDEGVQFDKMYPERLSVKNVSDDMDEYVRLTVRKYWATAAPLASVSADDMGLATIAAVEEPTSSDEDAVSDAMEKAAELSQPKKDTSLNPAHIALEFDGNNEGDWVFSAEESTDERLVFYYKQVLKAGEEAASPAVTGIAVSSSLREDPAAANGAYANCYLGLAAQVDSVQVNNAVDAAKSAWGVDVTQFEQYGLNWTDEN